MNIQFWDSASAWCSTHHVDWMRFGRQFRAPFALLFTLPLVLQLTACAPVEHAQVVILVRHAEKAADPASDPVLTEQGVARAHALADRLAGVPIDRIITSPLARTRLTAQFVAARHGIELEIIPIEHGLPEHIQSVAMAVRSRPVGESILIVGHSNTIPSIVQALGGSPIGPIADEDYSRFIVLVIDPDGSTRTVQAAFD